jgi:hypothetical protein
MLELGRGKGSPKSAKSLAQLITINGTGAIVVKVHKNILPVFDVFPEACKLCDCDWGCVIVGMNVVDEETRRASLNPIVQL